MSHCGLDIWRTDLKIHRVNARGTAYIKAQFRRNSLKNNGENCIQLIWNCWIGIFYFMSLWSSPLTCAPQNVYRSSTYQYLLIDYIWDRSDEETPEKSWNASRTDFQRLSPRDLDLCLMILQMHKYNVLANGCTRYCLWTGQIWERSDEKWQWNRRTKIAGKK